MKYELDDDALNAIRVILGNLNFSSGKLEPAFWAAWDSVFSSLATKKKPATLWRDSFALLLDGLDSLAQTDEAFRVCDRARFVLVFTRDRVLPAYRKFHADLLLHQPDEMIFNSFFLARVCEVVLSCEQDWGDQDTLETRIVHLLNDYIGYRPIPVLEGVEKHEADPHEWVAPVALYRKGVGAAFGRYHDLIARTVEILKATDPQLLRDAWFDPERMNELVVDPRAYDFDHPVNRRPNYSFGTWDPNCIGEDGYYERFVVHQVTLDGILQRTTVNEAGLIPITGIPRDELITEAAAVLAGTMLMGSGATGGHVQAHDSSVTLASLMPQIAAYRDRFYELLIERTPQPLQRRLKEEAKKYFQPFAGSRQSLNRYLAKKRADQLQRFHLARTYARMGYFQEAMKQATIIDVTSARFLSQIDCLISQAHLLIDRGKYEAAAPLLPQLDDLLHRGIACGALADPWSILGFGGEYSLFPAVDCTIHDHRLDDLVNLMNDIFDLQSRLQKEAAAAGNSELRAEVSERMSDLAAWWDQYGSTEVSGVEGFSGEAVWQSACMVSSALAAWHQAGPEAGGVAFWRRHVERFKSPKAFVLLAEALLDQNDLVSTMSLLMHWLSQSEEIVLTEGDYSFHTIASRWFECLWQDTCGDDDGGVARNRVKFPGAMTKKIPESISEKWKMTQSFLDRLEANADKYWLVPELELDPDCFEETPKAKNDADTAANDHDRESGGEEDDEDAERRGIDPLYKAAYEQVTFRDSAEDGTEDDTLDQGGSTFRDGDDFDLSRETDRINERLAFVYSVVKMWKYTASKSMLLFDGERRELNVADSMNGWLEQSRRFRDGLYLLLDQTSRYSIPKPTGTSDSMLEYDQHRGTKEILLDRIIWSIVEVSDTILSLEATLFRPDTGNMTTFDSTVKRAASTAPAKDSNERIRARCRRQRVAGPQDIGDTPDWVPCVRDVFNALYRLDLPMFELVWHQTLTKLERETLLYIPTSRGGNPRLIVNCRCLQQIVLRLFESLPRMGLLVETFELLRTVQNMERVRPTLPGAITEFDRLFESTTKAVSECIAFSGKTHLQNDASESSLDEVVELEEKAVDVLLECWLSHSRHIRISALESLQNDYAWRPIRKFVTVYGEDLFTQQFLSFRNIRAILHQGVKPYLQTLVHIYESKEELEFGTRLVEDLIAGKTKINSATNTLEIILECIAENYSVYIDYNSTTTQSDHGDKLYMLLDMLRILTSYERISWNLKPVYWIHETLIRSGLLETAARWESNISHKSVGLANENIQNYARLNREYGIWLPSIHDRLEERFVRPLKVDRMLGFVGPAIKDVRNENASDAFAKLKELVEEFAAAPGGVGFDVPDWLADLEEEIASNQIGVTLDDSDNPSDYLKDTVAVPRRVITFAEIARQIDYVRDSISFRE